MRPKDETKAEQLKALLAPPPQSSLRAPDPHFTRNRDVMLRFLEGQSVQQIALDKQLTAANVKAILRTQPVKAEIHRLAGLANDRYIQERVDMLTIEALDTVRDTMRGENANELRFKAAKEILERSPILKAKEQGFAGAVGAGIGEAIIRHLAQEDSRAAERARSIEAVAIEPGSKEETP
jgi:hypothetical protein